MDLATLYDRVHYEVEYGDGHCSKPVKVMTPDGEVYDSLSLNWDGENDQWILTSDGDS